MNAKKLQDLIETLKTRILNHGSRLEESEALTRYALVDPLLRELRWDTEDPAQVRPEYPLKSKDSRADYVLLGDDLDGRGFFLETKPVLLIEAKSLFGDGERDVEKELRDAALQAEHYSSSDGVRYFAATDGRRWYVYDRKFGYGPTERQIRSFDLMEGKKAIKDCIQAEELWRSTWHVEFVHGWRVDFDGKVRSPENGKENKRHTKSRPRGTRWILDGKFLNAAGWVLTPGGDQSSRFNAPCPPDTVEIVDGKFFDANGKEIRPKGRRR